MGMVEMIRLADEPWAPVAQGHPGAEVERCFPQLFVLVLRVSSTRTRTRKYGIEYEYEYHFIEYEYDKSQNRATSKANGEEVAIMHSCRVN